MSLVPRIQSLNTNNKFAIPTTLTFSSPNITATFGGQSYSVNIGTPTANTLFFLYLSPSGLAQSTTVPSIYIPSNSGAAVVGAYYSNGAPVVTFGSFVNINGAPSSEWVDGGALQWSAVTTPPTYGSMTTFQNKMKWRRVGDTMEVSAILNKNAVGTATAGSGQYILLNPTNIAIDTTKHLADTGASSQTAQPRPAQASVGHVTQQQDGTTLGEGFISVFSTSGVSMHINDQLANSGSGQGPMSSGYYPMNQTGTYTFNYSVAVSGWHQTPLKDL